MEAYILYRASGKVPGCDPTLLGKKSHQITLFEQNCIIYEIISQNPLFHTFGPKLHFLAKIALL